MFLKQLKLRLMGTRNSQQIQLPRFLIIGAQKSGTSWLHSQLRENPDVFLPENKDFEVDFTKKEELIAYKKRFENAPAQALIGDACAAWFWTCRGNDPSTGQPRNIVDDIHATFGPNIKTIILVREPVNRTISGYLHHLRFKSLSPNVALQHADPALGLLELSRYGFHLQNWLLRYSPKNVLVTPAPTETDPTSILRNVNNFLELHETTTYTNPRQVIMPGLKIIRDKEGVWVDLDAIDFSEHKLTRKVPVKSWNDRTFACLISAEEISWVASQLTEDTRHFLNLAKKHGWSHEAFNQWA
jgi:hypothetical protein